MAQSQDQSDNKRMAARMATWTEDEWRPWYAEQARHIEERAIRSNPDVRRTLEWSLPFFYGVAAGRIPPVLPPAPRPKSTKAPWQEIEGTIPAPLPASTAASRRKKLALKPRAKAPAKEGMADVRATA